MPTAHDSDASQGTGLLSLLDDQPVADQLWPGLEELSRKLATSLPSFPASSPVLLSGPWGSGKTSLLWNLDQTLEASETPVCIFEAWRYEGELPLLAALVRTIHDKVKESPQWLSASKAEEAQDLASRLWQASVSLSLGAAPALATLLGGPAGQVLGSLVKGLEKAAKGDKVAPTPDELLDQLTTDHSEKLWRAFRDLIELVAEPNRPFVILIDDLDRCSPEETVRLLDSIRHVVARAGAKGVAQEDLPLRFVAALDRGVLADAIRNKFAAMSAFDGNRYLEKIFPLVFTLPVPGVKEIQSFVEEIAASLLGLSDEDSGIVQSVFSNPIFANARLIKRVLNRYALWLSFERDDESRQVSPEVLGEAELSERLNLVRWLAVCERWPTLRGLLARRDSEYWPAFWDYAQGTDDDDQAPDAEARRILEEQDLRTWLTKRENDAIGAEAAERSLRKWGL